MATQVLDSTAVQHLDSIIKGDVLTPDRDGYDEARACFNSMIENRPAVLVRCKDPADVIASIELARARACEVSVRSGGHGVTGSQLADGGLAIDMSPMKRIQIDTEAKQAHVQAGVTWGELDAATQEHGLVVTGGRVPTTGVAGLTLGGGSGWIERKFGYTCDSLIEADVVTADGRFLRANANDNADLLWALKGGGGNFGVVTQFMFQLHELGPMLFGGMLVWPGFMAGQIARGYRDFIATAPDEVGGGLALLTAPPEPFVPVEAQGKPAVAVIACYAGSPEDGERAFAPVRAIAPPAVDLLGPMPYTAVQRLIEPGNPPGHRHYWKADLLDDLPDAAIDSVAELHSRIPSPLSLALLQPLGGAVNRVPADASALGRRDAGWAYHAISQWLTPEEDERNVGWARELSAMMSPYATGGVPTTFSSDTGDARVKDVYRDHLDRLVAIKDHYDPGNMFHLGQNIRPSTEATARADQPG